MNKCEWGYPQHLIIQAIPQAQEGINGLCLMCESWGLMDGPKKFGHCPILNP